MQNVNEKNWFTVKMSIAADATYPAQVLWLSDIVLADNGDAESSGWDEDETKALWLPNKALADRVVTLEQRYEEQYGDGLVEKIEIVAKSETASAA